MNIQTPFTFSSAAALGVWAFGGLRLLALCLDGQVLRGFLVFLASRLHTQRLSSSLFHSVRPPQTRPFHTAWSNPAVKLTRQWRAAYFVR